MLEPIQPEPFARNRVVKLFQMQLSYHYLDSRGKEERTGLVKEGTH